MRKKDYRADNGEGTVYETIQKVKKKFDNSKMCLTCQKCKDRSLCNNRTGWEKCKICVECKDCVNKKGFCDRFYCYDIHQAQITINR